MHSQLSGPKGEVARLRVARVMVVVLATLLAALAAPSLASARFTRPFLCRIDTPFSEAEGVALDAGDHLWVGEDLPGGHEGEPGPGKLYEFEPAYASCGGFVKSLGVEGIDSLTQLAIDDASGDFYVTGGLRNSPSGDSYVEVFDGAGKLVERWGPKFKDAHLAIDNSTDPADLAAGSVYLAHWEDLQGPVGDGMAPGIGRFDAEGKASPFTGSGVGPGGSRCEKYIAGNQIFGTPTECFRPEALTADSEGNVYAVNDGSDGSDAVAVYEFSPAGVFEREFNGAETPGLAGNKENGGFGGNLAGVAVDPVSHHLLVGVWSNSLGQKVGAIDEFDAATGRFLDQILETSPGQRPRRPTVVGVDSHGDLYVRDTTGTLELEQEHAIDVYGPGRFLPTLALGQATGRTPDSAEVTGTVDPEGFALAECQFQYVTAEAFEHNVEAHAGDEAEGFADLSSGGTAPCVPGAGSLPPNATSQVHADLSGLTSGVTYRYRIAASSSGALGGASTSAALAFTAPHAPRVDAVSVTNLSSEFADLHAQIDPLGASTTYRFQYVDQAHYAAGAAEPYAAGATAPVVPASIGSGGLTGSADANVVQQIGGLTPGTTYRFRVLAENALGTAAAGPQAEGTFATLPQATPGLPDGRAYEMLTPPNKAGAPDLFSQTAGQVVENRDVGLPVDSGEGFLLESNSAFGSPEHPFPASTANVYLFSRTEVGWKFSPFASPQLGVQAIGFPIFDPSDLSQVGFTDDSGSAASEGGAVPLVLVGPPGGPYTELHADAPKHAGERSTNAEETAIMGASHGLGRVILLSEDLGLCPGAAGQDAGSATLCEWAGGFEVVGGESRPQLTLVDVDSEGALLSRCGARLGQGSETSGAAHGAVSGDGSKVFFTAPDPYLHGEPGCWNGGVVNAPQLYMRAHGETIEVSAPESGVADPTGRHPALYVGAAENGSKVFFVSETELTKDDSFHDTELYEYDTETGALTRISAGEPGSLVRTPGGTGSHVWTVPAISADGSTVYFTARAQLTADAPALSGEGVALYSYDTQTHATTYVTTVNEHDYVDDEAGNWITTLGAGQVALSPRAEWYTTPDGHYLLFATGRELTGYSTAGKCLLPEEGGGGSNGHCDEVYRYDAAAAEKHEQAIVCVSCNPSGVRPVDNARFERSAVSNNANGPTPAMSDNGAYVFFDTRDALVPQDTNGTLDVYEWHAGRVSLISSGQDPAASFFVGESPYVTSSGEKVEGGNVFFGTHARLVPQDTDTNGDLYDARIGGGFAGAESGAAVCEGDACQNPPPSPIDSTPVSLTFAGPGNVASDAQQAPAPKKKVKRKKVKRKKTKGKRKAGARGARRGHGNATGRAGR